MTSTAGESTSWRPRRGRRIRRAGLGMTMTAMLICGGSVAALASDGAKIAELFESSFAHEATGKTTNALADVKAVLQMDGDHYVANLRAGWLHYRSGEYADSIQFYRKAVALAPRAVEPKLGLMLPLMAAKRWSEAERTGKQIMTTAPRNYLAASRVAYIHYVQGRYARAEEGYQAVLRDYPSDLDMMLGLAWIYLKQGRNPDARAMFQRVLSIRRKNESAKAGMQALGH